MSRFVMFTTASGVDVLLNADRIVRTVQNDNRHCRLVIDDGTSEGDTCFVSGDLLDVMEALNGHELDEDEAAPTGELRSQSSVEIAENAKGEPKVTVKAYEGSDVGQPSAEALMRFRELRAELKKDLGS